MDLIFFVPEPDGSYRRFDETHVQKAHSEEEIREAAAAAGFAQTECYTFGTGSPAGPTA